MKKLSYFISLACIALFASCSSDIEDFNAEGQSGKILSIGVNLPGAAETRLNTSDIEGMTWEETDKLYAIGFDETGNQVGIQTWSLSSSPGSTSAKFSGNAVEKATKYKFMYSEQGEGVFQEYGAPNVTYLDQVQNGINSNHLKNTVALQSDLVDLSTTSIVNMMPQCAIMRMNIVNLPDVIKDAESFKIQFTVNSPWIKDPDASITYNGKIAAGGNNFVYLAYNGMNPPYGAGYFFKVEITVGDKVVIAQAPETTYLQYNFGKVYTTTLNYADAGTEGDPWEWTVPDSGSGVDPNPDPDPQPETGTLTDLFSETFASNLGDFTIEDSNGGGFTMWQYDGANSMALVDAYATVSFGILGQNRLVSPEITLAAKNYVEFESAASYFADFVNQTAFSIREVTEVNGVKTYGEWTDVKLVGQENNAQFVTQHVDIDKGFDGKTVQVALWVSSKGGSSGVWWGVIDLIVKGYK